MRLNAVSILCADIAASLAFYRMLGVPFPDYDPDEGHYSADLGNGFMLMLDTYQVAEAFNTNFAPPSGNDVMTLAVELDTPDEVDKVFATVVTSGYESVREPFDAFWGQRYASVADPDGNVVDLYATLS